MKHQKDCIFCKIIQGEIPGPRVYEDDSTIVINDIQPHAKVHLLVIPKRHVVSLDAAFPEGMAGEDRMVGGLFAVAAKVAREKGLMPGGYRTIFNTNSNAGQTIFHLHLHVLGGEPLRGALG